MVGKGDVADPPVYPNSRSLEKVFGDYCGRRAGIVKALTQDVEEFYRQCDPKKENLCLFGLPNEIWELNLPTEEVPPILPEPPLGINFARDGMAKKDWLSLVAVHSDAWLLSVAFYFAGRFGFDTEARKRLFMMINDLPTVFETVAGMDKKPAKTPNGCSKHKSGSKPPKQPNYNSKPPKQQAKEKLEEDDGGAEEGEDQASTMCGLCGVNYAANGQFWIGCDFCDGWFHGSCVRITPGKADQIKHYRCPLCERRASSGSASTRRSRECAGKNDACG